MSNVPWEVLLSIFLDVVLVKVTLQVQYLLRGKVILVRKLDKQPVIVEFTCESLCTKSCHEGAWNRQDSVFHDLAEKRGGLSSHDVVTHHSS